MRSWMLLCVVAAPLIAQSPRADVRGRIVDGLDRAGISGALVSIPALGLVVRADGLGRYRLADIPAGNHELDVRAIGYDSLKIALIVRADTSFDVQMTRVPTLLSQMNVVGRSLRVPHGFEDIYRRAGRGAGKLITREQIDSINPMDLKTMLAPLPGLYVNHTSVYFMRCGPGEMGHVWVDGQRVTKFRTGPRSDPLDINLHLVGLRPTEVQAIEVYTSQLQVPGEFLDGRPCGVVAIWTRRGPSL